MNLKGIIPWKNKETASLRRPSDVDTFSELQRQMNVLFDDLFGRSSLESWPSGPDGFAPRADISETGSELLVSVELPGLDEKDVEVTVTGSLLSIKGEKKAGHEEKKGDYWHSERSYGHFERTLEIPPGLENEKIKASFKKGVLTVSIPKAPGAQSKVRRIELD